MSMKSLPLFVAGALLVAALPAQAIESERNWVLELQFGGYSPDVDKEVQGTPFADVFGNKNRLLTQLAIQRLVFQDFGSLGIGFNGGYSRFTGQGFLEDTDERAPDDTSLTIVPLTAFLAYRFDLPANLWDVPLVPYGKVGFGGWLFWINDALGETAGDGEAQGVRWGWSWSAGLNLVLDFFDPRLAGDFDRSFGVNNTSIYVDYTKVNVDDFGGKGFNFSDEIWSGGIAFEF